MCAVMANPMETVFPNPQRDPGSVRPMNREGDAALAGRLMAREEAALTEAVQIHGGLVNGVARRVLADVALAEEVAQDVFVALWRRPGAFDPDRGSLKTFLATLARNKAVDLVRREESSRRTKDMLLAEANTQTQSYDVAVNVDDRADISEALDRIPALQREAIVLAYFGGRTYREVAAELGIPEGTAKTRMRDGLAKLRAVLSRDPQEAGDD